MKTPPEGEVFRGGHTIALAIAMTCERTLMRTMSFRFVTTFNKASFMTVSSKQIGETTPQRERNPPGGEKTMAGRERLGCDGLGFA